ncbi:rano class II histocompatibility antigen, A beta chain-like isoform X2 [Electrophorus electricus]|uniref:Ig-like domain-containing protein n=1 Tax=Electrophorus electricus TaxID=8005 RepID=A0A4W4DP51_ELEEL|nr:rano class II histocompatibility antigen, A beta chain-like isoform X2 [Electrophorus electricus]
MCEAPVFPVVIFIFGLSIPVNSHYLSTLVQCYTRGSLQNTEFTISMMYNRGKFLTYNSTENAFIGYSDYGAKWANNLNNRTDWLHSEAEKILSDCREYGAQVTTILNTTVRPVVVVRSLGSAMLICSAYDFYPKGIKVSWLRDGEPLTSEVTSTEELADGDWYYQIHSHLEHTPKSGEKISCVVEHASFQKPIVCDWEPSLPETERSKLALGAVGLMLGVITAAAGLTYYRCKQSEWTSVLS